MIRKTLIVSSLLMLTTAVLAGNKSGKNATIIDQGAFGVFQNGQRTATETFTIRQYPDSNVTSSELIGEDNSSGGKVRQTSDLTLLPNGNLSRYEWKQLSPGHNSAVVEPNGQVLVMRSVTDGKSHEKTFFLAPDTFVLDDYVFSTREVLLWRYLASYCKPRPAGDGCDLARTRFPVIIPRRNTSAEVYLEFKGYDDTPLNGHPQHLRHFVLQSEGPDWHLWIDSNHKLLRISIPDANTEILRQEK